MFCHIQCRYLIHENVEGYIIICSCLNGFKDQEDAEVDRPCLYSRSLTVLSAPSLSDGCATGEYRCADGMCVLEDRRCDGFVDCDDYSDEDNCTECREGMYHCVNASKCIPFSQRCDYFNDCGDNSDEVDCVCNPERVFECASGGCIDITWRCDSVLDCDDDSDETNCSECADGTFLCEADDICIPNDYRCDAYDHDCSDNGDQLNCTECQSNSFLCEAEHKCIDGNYLCDFYDDCDDGSDEASVLCGLTTPMNPGICPLSAVVICQLANKITITRVGITYLEDFLTILINLQHGRWIQCNLGMHASSHPITRLQSSQTFV